MNFLKKFLHLRIMSNHSDILIGIELQRKWTTLLDLFDKQTNVLNKMADELFDIKQKINQIMANEQQFLDILSRIDTATNNIAEDLRRIKDQLAGGLSAEAATRIQAQLESKAVTLEGIAASTEEPVPEEPTEPTEPENPPA